MNDDANIFNLYLETSAEEPQMHLSADGSKEWYLNGKLHRDGAPAIIHSNGEMLWFQHGKLHREGGPAVKRTDFKAWYLHDMLHREDGPAVEFKNGAKKWYLKSKNYSTPEKWAAAVLSMHNKPSGIADINTYLKQVLKKDIEEAL